MDNTIASFLVALGFDVNQGSLNTAKKSIADYEKAVRDAEKRIEDARWEGAKTADEIAKLTREANLKEARAALATAQEREKAEKETARKREERNKEFMAGMSRLALAATAAATAISYAVNRVTQAFDNLGFVSARTGASVQSLNSLGYAFKQVGGSSQQAVSAVEKFAQALRTNDGLKSYVKSLGVDTTKDMADQLLDTVDALSKHEYQVGSREAGMLGISEEDYKLLTQYAAKVKEYRAEYDATTKALGVNSKEAADASMAFQRTLTRLQATVSALGDKLMVSLAPALEQIVRRFQEWIAANPEKVERIMRGISDAVVWLAEKLSAMVTWFAGSEGEAFMKRWDAFADKVKAIASAFEAIFGILQKIASVTKLSAILGGYDKVITSILAGPAAFERANGGPPAPVVDNRSVYQRYAPTILGGKPDPNGDARGGVYARVRRALGARSAGAQAGDGVETPTENGMVTVRGHRYRAGAGTEQGKARVASWLDFAQRPVEQGGLGLPADKARAIVAGLQGESSANLNPNSLGDYRGSTPTAFGTAQWRLDRAEGLRRTAAEMGTSWNDIKAQQAWMRKEMVEGRYRGVYESIKGAANGEAALREYINRYENPADHAGAYAFRKPYLDTLRRQGDQKPIQVTAPKIEVKGGGTGSGAAPEIHIPGVPKMMQMPGFNVGDYMKPAPEASSSVVNSGGNSTKTINQTFNNKTTVTGAENPKQAAGIMESAFGRMHNLALANAQSATV